MNNSSADAEGMPPYLIGLRTSFIVLLAMVVTFGNILSIAVTRRVTTLADSTKVLMMTLAVYDLVLGLSAFSNVVASALDRWPFSELGCRIVTAVKFVSLVMSVVSMLLLNIERFLAVTRPYRFPIWCSKRRVIQVVLVSSTLTLSIAVVTFQTPAQYFPSAVSCFHAQNSNTVNVLMLIFLDIIPTLTITCIYCILIKISHQHKQRINPNGVNAANKIQDNKALKTFLLVTLTFAGCYTPAMVSRALSGYVKVSIPAWLHFIMIWLMSCNSGFNVFIYCLFFQAYRQMAKKIITDWFTFRCKT